jgi:Fe-S-cluster containining protein
MAVDDELAMLCQSCGLCCDGSLFGRVRLEAEEVEPARKRRLRVLDSGKGFEQACSALAGLEGESGRRICSIYSARPRACRTFVCRLHERHRREGGPIEPRLVAVRRVRELVGYLEASGMTAADLAGEGGMTEALEDFARAQPG